MSLALPPERFSPLSYVRGLKKRFFLSRLILFSLLRVWFDILTPKQVMFFKPAVDMLKTQDHEILCTSREYREANELARLRQLELRIVGKHGGADRSQKLWQSANRILKLTDIIKSFEPEVSISFSSPEACRVAFGLGIKNIGFNDSPHADAVAKLSLPLLDLLLCPWIIPNSAWTKYGVQRGNIIKYRALDPVAWLHKGSTPFSSEPNSYKHREQVRDIYEKKTVLIRMEEAQASYIADKNFVASTIDMIDRIIKNLSDVANFCILCRYEDQRKEISARYLGKANVISNVIDGAALISQSDIFIGAGGTMTTEAALLGKPTISIAPVSFYVEKYLVSRGLAEKASSPEALEKITKKMATDQYYAQKQLKRATRAVEKMEDPMEKLVLLLNTDA
jgi:predicted glycosyltransferase